MSCLRFLYGKRIRIWFLFWDSDGNLEDPSEVYAWLVSPSGVEYSYQFGADPEIVRTAKGTYKREWIPDEYSHNKAWHAYSRGIGVIDQASRQTFFVVPPPVANPNP